MQVETYTRAQGSDADENLESDIPEGDPGERGDPGASGVSGYQTVFSEPTPVPEGQISFATVACPNGKKAVGGGFITDDRVIIRGSRPDIFGAGWLVVVQMRPGAPGSGSVQVHAACVTAL